MRSFFFLHFSFHSLKLPNSENSADFEEDTYLDLHIFQAGKKLGKKICGVEDFDGSMQLVKEAYSDAAKEKTKKERSYDIDEALSFQHMEEAYRTGNLDLLDTINKVNSRSAAFDEKFLYKRNEIQANSIDSILKKGAALFVGVGAAHLPGERGVIEMLRKMGYTLRPIKMRERDSYHKDAIEKMRVPVQFAKQTSEDGFFSVNIPGKLYSFGKSYTGADMQQYADMMNGSYYMVTRLFTNAAIIGHDEALVERKIDSVLYENIPGKILTKKPIIKNGYKGFEITNRTRRGDFQRYNIFVTPFEILVFKMSGNGDYVKLGTEAAQFFNSIQLKEFKPEWKKFRPAHGGFEVEMPHEPLTIANENMVYGAYDAATKTAFEILRTDIHNYAFLEEDSFDLNLMEESFASSDFVQRQLSQQASMVNGYPALDVRYKFKDSSVALVRFLINGPRYYTLVAKSGTENRSMQQFVHSFQIKPFVYSDAKKETDTALFYTVKTPVALYKKQKLAMYPEGNFYGGYDGNDADDSLVDNGKYIDRIVSNDSTGEKIYVSFYKNSRYFYNTEKDKRSDSLDLDDEWVIRKKKIDTLADKTVVSEYEFGSKKSSRLLKAKGIEKNGFGYQLQTEIDTISAPSSFITGFFQSFTPVDTVKGIDIKKKKTDLFFSQLFSADTMLHKTALKNVHNVVMDSSDFSMLKKGIQFLGWKEKKYLDVKKDFIGKLSSMPTKAAADYLKELYYQAGDTLDLQYAALEVLLRQKTEYAYKTFAEIMENDPPVLDLNTSTASYARRGRFSMDAMDTSTDYNYMNGSFMDDLSDTLQLTAGIFKNLLPLINLNDYEQPVMDLAATLLDSSMIEAKAYEVY
ncbi:MAG: TraB/GumN family protein, partial [Chitinophagaceae bacterium]